MTGDPKHLRSLYDIAVSIGGSLDLEIMARAALMSYHRKLGSVASSVIRDTANGAYVYCCCGQGSKTHKQFLLKLDQSPKTESGALIFMKAQEYYHYLFELPKFGALALSTKTPIHQDIIQDLYVLNSNFAAACIACVQNQAMQHTQAQSQKALQIKNEFLANISHELRTPMNAVIGFANLLQRNTKPERVGEYADRIVNSADLLMTLINDMLDFTSNDHLNSKSQFLTFDLKEEMISVLSPLQRLAQVKSMTFNIDVLHDQPGLQVATSKRLAQVLAKLCENAVKFCDEGDHISVVCDPQIIEDNTEGEISQLLTFTVKDTGPGIPEQLKDQLFDSFHQGDNSTQRAFQGAGLGLAICKKHVEQAGGDINLIDTKTGCEIEFTWPCVQVHEHSQDPILSKSHFLIVDDNLVNREVLKAMLERFGSSVELATNGLEAINACQTGKYDLIFMDCHMPVMNGMDASKVIRNLGGQYKNIPIVALTADITSECSKKCLEAGMDRFINKPMLQKTIESLATELIRKSA